MSRGAMPIELVDASGALYVAAPKIYPGEVDGRLQRLRTLAVVVLLGLFYLLPWLQWNGHQAVLLDLPARKFHLLGLTLWPQDFPYLAALLAVAGLALFFFTALAGRLWCGYACPQTVWTEVFLWIERRVEGKRNQRMRLDREPWHARKIVRKATKHSLWILLAAWTGFTFVGFFTPVTTLAASIAEWRAGPWEVFWMGFYGFATYGNAGWLREQVCKYMCPYARFQGAMLDRDSLVIAYDPARGEPRGRARLRDARRDAPAFGDCIDCSVCVQVCPTGIDIRDGLQYECIGCGACIDGCNGVMDKLGRARGLIRYTTERALGGAHTRILRPRVAIYGALLVALSAGLLWSLTHRTPLLVDVLRDRNALYRVAAGGVVENAYALKVVNKDGVPHRYRVALEGAEGIALDDADASFEVPAGGIATHAMTLRAQVEVRGKREIAVRVTDADNPAVTRLEPTRFFGPQVP